MKKIFLTLLVFIMSNISFSQSSCACDEMFGSCNVVCPSGTYANCKGTWYGSCTCTCTCSCIPYTTGGGSKFIEFIAPSIVGTLNLKDIDKLQLIFEESKNENLSELINLKNELLAKSENGVYSTKNEREYNLYFNDLKIFFYSLDIEMKQKLVNLINS